MMFAAELAIGINAEQHMGRAATIGDEDRCVARESLRLAYILIKLAARHHPHHPPLI